MPDEFDLKKVFEDQLVQDFVQRYYAVPKDALGKTEAFAAVKTAMRAALREQLPPVDVSAFPAELHAGSDLRNGSYFSVLSEHIDVESVTDADVQALKAQARRETHELDQAADKAGGYALLTDALEQMDEAAFDALMMEKQLFKRER